MGPFWDGNEVWLITAGGVTFAAFPRTYAVMFSGLYTPLMLLLFALILRGVAFEFRGKVDSGAWRRTWDACLVLGSFLPALLLGVAFANIFEGLPIDAAGDLPRQPAHPAQPLRPGGRAHLRAGVRGARPALAGRPRPKAPPAGPRRGPGPAPVAGGGRAGGAVPGHDLVLHPALAATSWPSPTCCPCPCWRWPDCWGPGLDRPGRLVEGLVRLQRPHPGHRCCSAWRGCSPTCCPPAWTRRPASPPSTARPARSP